MLTPNQRQALKDALIASLPTVDHLEMMLDEQIDPSIDIPNADSYTVQVYKLVKNAAAGGRIIDLVIGASRTEPGNPELRSFIQNHIASLLLLKPISLPNAKYLSELVQLLLPLESFSEVVWPACIQTLPDVELKHSRVKSDLENTALSPAYKWLILLQLLLQTHRCTTDNQLSISKFIQQLQHRSTPPLYANLTEWLAQLPPELQPDTVSLDPLVSDSTSSRVVLHNLPQPDYEKFIGRKKEKEKIIAKLRPYPYSRNSVITIDGIGGIGKSTLALEIGHYFLQNCNILGDNEFFDAIVWTSAKTSVLRSDKGIVKKNYSSKTLIDICKKIAVTLELENSIDPETKEGFEFICRELSKKRVLLIVDNFETIDDEKVREFLQDILPPPTKAIITTRHRIDIAYPIRLFGMSEDEAQQLIEQECLKKQLVINKQQKEKIFKRTGGIPLAMIWTIAKLSYGKDIDSTLARLSSHRNDVAEYCFREIIHNIGKRDSYKVLLSLALLKGVANRRDLCNIAGFKDDEVSCDEGIEELQKLSLINRKEENFIMLALTKEYVTYDLQKSTKFLSEARSRLAEYEVITKKIYNIILLGSSSSGKTTFLSTLFKQLSVQTNERIFLEAQDNRQQKQLNNIYSQLLAGDAWPSSTRSEFSTYNFTCNIMTLNLEIYSACQFNFLDYGGRILTDLEEEEDSLFDFSDKISNADAVMVLIDGYKLFKCIQGDLNQRKQNIAKFLLKDMSNAIQLANLSTKDTPLHFVITKWDLLEGYYDFLSVRKFLQENFDDFKRLISTRIKAGCPVRLIPTSSFGKGFVTMQPDGSIKRNSGELPKPSQIEIPLNYVLIDRAAAYYNHLDEDDNDFVNSGEHKINFLMEMIPASLRRNTLVTHEERNQKLDNISDQKTAFSYLIDTFVNHIQKFEKEFPYSDLGVDNNE